MKPTTRIEDPFADLFEEQDDSLMLEESIYDEVENYYGDDLIDMVGGSLESQDDEF